MTTLEIISLVSKIFFGLGIVLIAIGAFLFKKGDLLSMIREVRQQEETYDQGYEEDNLTRGMYYDNQFAPDKKERKPKVFNKPEKVVAYDDTELPPAESVKKNTESLNLPNTSPLAVQKPSSTEPLKSKNTEPLKKQGTQPLVFEQTTEPQAPEQMSKSQTEPLKNKNTEPLKAPGNTQPLRAAGNTQPLQASGNTQPLNVSEILGQTEALVKNQTDVLE